jgi:hypothetical protein
MKQRARNFSFVICSILNMPQKMIADKLLCVLMPAEIMSWPLILKQHLVCYVRLPLLSSEKYNNENRYKILTIVFHNAFW